MISVYLCMLLNIGIFFLFLGTENVLLALVALGVCLYILNFVRQKQKMINLNKQKKDLNHEICIHTELDCQECMSQRHCKHQLANRL